MLEAAAREFTGETGYISRDLDLEQVATLHATSFLGQRHVVVARNCRPLGEQALDEYEDGEPVVLDVAEVRAELKAGTMTATDLTYVALDHAGLL